MTTEAHSVSPPTRVLLAIGTARYTEPAYQESEERSQEPDSLSQSVPRSLSYVVEAFQRSRGVETELPKEFVLDPSTQQLRRILAEAGSAADVVIIYYTGHGEQFGRDGYYLITTDFKKSDLLETGIKAAELPRLVVKRGAEGEIDRQQPEVLLILDCCFAGAGGLEVLRDAVLGGPNPNLWVYATAGEKQYATSGVFARALADVLSRPNVGASSEYISLDTVLDRIERALVGADQRAEIFKGRFSTFPKFFANRHFIPRVTGLTVAEQHWRSKARGGPETAGAGFYLTGCTGRVQAAQDLARWITNPAAGNLAVMTGSPGTGKSALLSLPVMLSDPASRDLLLTGTAEGSLAHQTAELLPVDTGVVAVHARGLNTDRVAQAISAGMGRPATSAMALLESLDENPPQQAPVVIVDALDEATAPARLRDSLLLTLAREHPVRIVLGARGHVLPAQRITPATVIDLDTETYQDPQALAEYVHQLLVAAREPGVDTPYHDAAGETQRIAAEIAHRATSARVESFLIARGLALAVRARADPVDTTAEAWTQRLPDGWAEAFDEDLDRLGERTPVARVLLEALAWARGPGLPWETIWVPVARALAGLHGDTETGQELTDDDVRWLLDRAGAYVVEDLGAGGLSVFRPFHDRLAEYLRASSATTDDDTARVQAAMAAALLNTLGPNGARRWDRAHTYLRTYLGEHALTAGADVFSALLGESGFLAVADPSTLTPLLSQAAPERDGIVRIYRRARSLLGEDPAANAAYLQEAALAVTGSRISFDGAAISPSYHTKWTRVSPDQSLLTLTGSTQRVRSVAFGAGAGGRPLLASGGRDGSVQVWDPESGDPVGRPLTGHTHRVRSVAFGAGAGGRPLLASGGRDGSVRVWDPESGDPVGRPLTGHTGCVLSVAFGAGAGGRPLLASGGDDGTVRLWDPESGDPVGRPLTGHTGCVLSVAFGAGAGGRALLASGGSDGTVRLWDPESGDPVGRPLTGHTGCVLSVSFGAGVGGRPLVASGGDDGTVRVWDPDTSTLVGRPLIGYTGCVLSVAFGAGAGGRALLASGGSDGTVRLWDPESGTLVGRPLTGHTHRVRSVAFGAGAGGRPLLASGGSDGSVRLWDPDTSTLVGRPLTGHTHRVRSVAFGAGAGGRPLLASRGEDDRVWLWDLESGDLVGRPLIGHTGSVRSVAFGTGAGGRPLLACGGDDGRVRLWDPETSTLVGEPLTGHTGWVLSVAFGAGAGGRPLLACGGLDGTVRVWDSDTGHPVGQPLTGHTGWVRSVVFGAGAGGRPMLASGGDDASVRLWDLESGDPVGQPLTGHTGWVQSVAFGAGAGGRPLLASGGRDKTVRVWDPDTGQPVGQPLTGHTRWVQSVAFGAGAGGRPLLASGGRDKTVRVWDPDTGVHLMTIRRRAPAARLASDGSIFAIGDQEGLSVIDIS